MDGLTDVECFESRESVMAAVIQTLEEAGVTVGKLSSKYQYSPSPSNSKSKIFGGSLLDPNQEKLACSFGTASLSLPRFVIEAVQLLQESVGCEGLFRKAGSVSRQKAIKVHLDSGTPLSSLVKDPVSPIATVSPHDLASLLKQYLRELATPLIPNDMAAILCACEDMDVRMVEGGEGRREVKGGGKRLVLLACVLLPAVHLQVLRMVVRLLSSVAREETNLMDTASLAVVMTPNIFRCSLDSLSTTTTSSSSGNSNGNSSGSSGHQMTLRIHTGTCTMAQMPSNSIDHKKMAARCQQKTPLDARKKRRSFLSRMRERDQGKQHSSRDRLSSHFGRTAPRLTNWPPSPPLPPSSSSHAPPPPPEQQVKQVNPAGPGFTSLCPPRPSPSTATKRPSNASNNNRFKKLVKQDFECSEEQEQVERVDLEGDFDDTDDDPLPVGVSGVADERKHQPRLLRVIPTSHTSSITPPSGKGAVSSSLCVSKRGSTAKRRRCQAPSFRHRSTDRLISDTAYSTSSSTPFKFNPNPPPSQLTRTPLTPSLPPLGTPFSFNPVCPISAGTPFEFNPSLPFGACSQNTASPNDETEDALLSTQNNSSTDNLLSLKRDKTIPRGVSRAAAMRNSISHPEFSQPKMAAAPYTCNKTPLTRKPLCCGGFVGGQVGVVACGSAIRQSSSLFGLREESSSAFTFSDPRVLAPDRCSSPVPASSDTGPPMGGDGDGDNNIHIERDRRLCSATDRFDWVGTNLQDQFDSAGVVGTGVPTGGGVGEKRDLLLDGECVDYDSLFEEDAAFLRTPSPDLLQEISLEMAHRYSSLSSPIISDLLNDAALPLTDCHGNRGSDSHSTSSSSHSIGSTAVSHSTNQTGSHSGVGIRNLHLRRNPLRVLSNDSYEQAVLHNGELSSLRPSSLSSLPLLAKASVGSLRDDKREKRANELASHKEKATTSSSRPHPPSHPHKIPPPILPPPVSFSTITPHRHTSRGTGLFPPLPSPWRKKEEVCGHGHLKLSRRAQAYLVKTSDAQEDKENHTKPDTTHCSSSHQRPLTTLGNWKQGKTQQAPREWIV